MAQAMNIDDFLGHKTRSGGSRIATLDNWTKRHVPQVDVWLSTKSPIVALWSHPWPRIVEREKDGEKKTIEVWSGRFNSWESEEILKSQYKRNRDDGSRELPPIVCPMSLMIECAYQAVLEGKLDWCEELFVFEGDDPDKAKVIHAGGLWNAFASEKLTDAQKNEMKKAGISPKNAWQENMQAKCSYVFQVVDNSEPEKGLQIAVQTTLIGDKVKSLIHDSIEADGPEQGNPLITPYCIRWKYLPNEKEFQKKYKAIKMGQIELTDEIEEIIQGEPRDTGDLLDRGNIDQLRDSFEAHYVGPTGIFNWDAIFEPAEKQRAAEGDSDEGPEEKPAPRRAPPKAQAKPAPVQSRKRAPEPEPEDDDEEEPAPAPSRRAAAPARSQRAAQPSEDDEPPARSQRAARRAPEPDPEPQPRARKRAPEPDPEPEADVDEEPIVCDTCSAEMTAEETICKECGHDYRTPEQKRADEAKAGKAKAAPAVAPKAGKPRSRAEF